MSNSPKSKKAIHKDGKIKFVLPELLENFLTEGWELGKGIPAWNKGLDASNPRVAKYVRKGKPCSEETKEKLRQKNLGKKWTPEAIATEVWTKRDTQKYLIAEKNKINYLVFYKKEDFLNWLQNYDDSQEKEEKGVSKKNDYSA